MVIFWTYCGERTGFAARMRSAGQIQGLGPVQPEIGVVTYGEGEEERGASRGGGGCSGRVLEPVSGEAFCTL